MKLETKLFRRLVIPCLAAPFLLVAGAVHGEVPYEIIPLGHLAPSDMALEYSWGSIGIDPEDNVYAVYCCDGGCPDPTQPADCALFQLNTDSGDVRLVGRLSEAARAAGNLAPNEHWAETEEIVKGHTQLPYLNGRVYIGTMGFHNLVGDELSQLPNYRGAHLFAYDVADDAIVDLSAPHPNGTLLEHQGLLALDKIESLDLIVGFGVPLGDLVFYDTITDEFIVAEGVTSEHGKSIPREIVTAPTGAVTFSYSSRGEASIFRHDLETDATTPVDHVTRHGFWNGQAKTRDGRTAYISTLGGNLYRVNTIASTFTDLGHMLPSEDYKAGARIEKTFGMSISLDEEKLYWMAFQTKGVAPFSLYEYDIKTGEIVELLNLNAEIGSELSRVSGSNVRDSKGRIYYALHDRTTAGAAIIQFDVGTRSRAFLGLYSPDTRNLELCRGGHSEATDWQYDFIPEGEGYALAGDWDGDGKETVGWYSSAEARFYLRNSQTAGEAEHVYAIKGRRQTRLIPIAGDWNGDGIDTVGLYDPERAKIALGGEHRNASPTYIMKLRKRYRKLLPMAGDWDGDGTETLGLYDPTKGRVFLFNAHTDKTHTKTYLIDKKSESRGKNGTPIAGDWDGSGYDKVGLYRSAAKKQFLLRENHKRRGTVKQIRCGKVEAGLQPIVGNWDGS